MSSKPFVINWGVLGCGGISSAFVKDIVRSPNDRHATDVSHAIAAVGSRSLDKAKDFIKDNCPEGGAAQKEGYSDITVKAKGSYKDCVEDPDVQVVYIGTMNTAHYDDCKLTLEAGKHCLLEKPATLNAAEWKSLVALAKEKKVFLMEACWTRFNPALLAVKKALHEENVIGDVHALYCDLSLNSFNRRPDSDRVFAAELAGGALLDLGPYPMIWSLMMLYHHPKNGKTAPERVGSTMLLHSTTKVDLATSWGMTFPKLNAMAHCSATLMAPTVPEYICRIVGSKGEISVTGHTSRPQGYVLRRLTDPSDENSGFEKDEVHDHGFAEHGLCFEADVVARSLRDGLTECPQMPLDETLLVTEIFDKIRRDGGYKYLPGLERVKLPQ